MPPFGSLPRFNPGVHQQPGGWSGLLTESQWIISILHSGRDSSSLLGVVKCKQYSVQPFGSTLVYLSPTYAVRATARGAENNIQFSTSPFFALQANARELKTIYHSLDPLSLPFGSNLVFYLFISYRP